MTSVLASTVHPASHISLEMGEMKNEKGAHHEQKSDLQTKRVQVVPEPAHIEHVEDGRGGGSAHGVPMMTEGNSVANAITDSVNIYF